MWPYGFHFSWIYNKEWNYGVIWKTLYEYLDGWHFEELPNCVQSGWNILNFHQRHVKAPIPPYHHKHIILLIIDNLQGVPSPTLIAPEWYCLVYTCNLLSPQGWQWCPKDSSWFSVLNFWLLCCFSLCYLYHGAISQIP